MGNSLSLLASVSVPIAVGAGIGMSIAPEIKGWYKTLKKPSWNPPSWVFGPVWTVLYAVMGYAAHRVWLAGGGALPLGLYAAQLGLNFAWSPLFFKLKNLKAASLEITAMLGMVAATIYEFSKVDPLAAQLMMPYLGWVSFATALTWNITLNNDQGGKRAKAAARDAADDVTASLSGAAAAAEAAGRQAGEAVHAGASEATAQAARVFLAQGGEHQGDAVPPEVVQATAARTGARKED